MSSLPGGTGDNIIYALLCGGAFAGAVAYVSLHLSIYTLICLSLDDVAHRGKNNTRLAFFHKPFNFIRWSFILLHG